jgi:hypothetical protein
MVEEASTTDTGTKDLCNARKKGLQGNGPDQTGVRVQKNQETEESVSKPRMAVLGHLFSDADQLSTLMGEAAVSWPR